MSHHGKLREHKACESCGHYVEKRFCPECGQENVETRQPFHYLFTVSIEDFVHYDSRFWKTILYLLFYPAKLTKVYLSGRRNLYVPPVTLYIFISFITFFLPTILPNHSDGLKKDMKEKVETSINQENATEEQKSKDNMQIHVKGKSIDTSGLNKDKLEERIKHDFPKTVFLYMPVFAFWLWLVHSKKKWYYFDHGIYTLHYFSFILLSILLYIVLEWIYSDFGLERFRWIKVPNAIFSIVFFCYLIYYFFHSHRLMYRERKAISRLICTFLFIVNTICMTVFLTSYLLIEVFITDPELFKKVMSAIKGM